MAECAWWTPARFAARRANLETRAALIAAIRGFFREREFVEVETPALQVSPGVEPHLIAFETALREPFPAGVGHGEAGHAGAGRPFYLHASPELAMKKLLVAGLPKLFQIARCFRNGERSAIHHPEFTMLEWYRAGASCRDLMDDCRALLRACAAALAPARFRRAGRSSDPFGDWSRLSVAAAFERYAGIDLRATAPDPACPDAGRLRAEAQRIGVRTDPGDGWDDVFFRIFLERIEHRLGAPTPTLLYDYPVSMAALARARPSDPAVAERFELFVCGLELANGYSELTDPVEHRRRFERDRARKEESSGPYYPIDEEFMAAQEQGLPDCAGISLGVDRLAMLATGAAAIEEVLWAPVAVAD